MKWLKKIQFSLLLSIFLSLLLSGTAFAQEAEYTYTVTLYAGNQGTLTGENLEKGIEVITSGDDVKVEQSEDKIVISGLHYNDQVNFTVQHAVDVMNEKYYVAGIRKSGRDNSELELSSYQVKGDRDYVIAYAIRGNMVAYTVNYQDAAGNTLLESNSFYGNIGESPVIAYRYIDGYRPQAYNLTKILSSNEEENVFTFVYNKLATDKTNTDADEVTEETEETTTPETSETMEENTEDEEDRLSAPIGQIITIIRNTIIGDNDNTSDSNAGTVVGNLGDNQNAASDEDDGSAEGEGIDSAMILDDGTPLSLLELSEEQVPLADMKDNGIRPGTEPNVLPVYMGIGILALLAILFLIIYCGRKREKESSENNHE